MPYFALDYTQRNGIKHSVSRTNAALLVVLVTKGAKYSGSGLRPLARAEHIANFSDVTMRYFVICQAGAWTLSMHSR